MEVQAIGKYLRITPRKLVPVAKSIKEKKPIEALKHLRFINKKGAKILANVLASAVANAKNNLKLDEANLVIKKIEVGKGPTLKRWQPVSRGRAHPILKRMSHLKVVLEAVEQPSEKTDGEYKTVEKTSLSHMANRELQKKKSIGDKQEAISATKGSK